MVDNYFHARDEASSSDSDFAREEAFNQQQGSHLKSALKKKSFDFRGLSQDSVPFESEWVNQTPSLNVRSSIKKGVSIDTTTRFLEDTTATQQRRVVDVTEIDAPSPKAKRKREAPIIHKKADRKLIKSVKAGLIRDGQTFQDYFFKQLNPKIIRRLQDMRQKRYAIETVEIDSDFQPDDEVDHEWEKFTRKQYFQDEVVPNARP